MVWDYNYKKQFDKYKEDIINKKYDVCDEQINYFYSYYKEEKKDNPNFDIDIEKSRLVFKINNQISSIITFYFGVIISILLCVISIYGEDLIKLFIILVASVLAILIICKIGVLNEQSDMWNRALIALEKIEKEEEEERTNKLQEQQIKELKRIKEFLNIK